MDDNPSGDVDTSAERRAKSRRRGCAVALLGTIAFCGFLIWVILPSIPIEESHEIGNDSSFDRVVIGGAITVIVICLVLLLLVPSFGETKQERRRRQAAVEDYERRWGPRA